MSETDIARVIEVFEANHVGWALVGGYANGLVTEPRATVDFDFIVEDAKIDSVVRALAEELGELDANDLGAAVRLRAIDVDLVRSTTHPLLRIALECTRTIGDWRVPRTEILVVLKFLNTVSAWRDRSKRMQDLADICFIWHAASELDRALMGELSALVYPGAKRDLSELLDKIDRGEPISI